MVAASMAWAGRILERRGGIESAIPPRRHAIAASTTRRERPARPRSTQTQDIGKGRYQYYAFSRGIPGARRRKRSPMARYRSSRRRLRAGRRTSTRFLDATREDEIEQRDLYDRPPSSLKPWSVGPVGLLGDSVHAMMPNLGQGGCQAIEDAIVLAEELKGLKSRTAADVALTNYRNRRLVRSAAVQGLSRFASDIIIRGFDTPAKIVDGRLENFNYAGIVTRLLQPILPIFFMVQFNFLYEGWRNEFAFDVKAGLLIGGLGLFLLAVGAGAVGDAAVLLPFGLESVFGVEASLGSRRLFRASSAAPRHGCEVVVASLSSLSLL